MHLKLKLINYFWMKNKMPKKKTKIELFEELAGIDKNGFLNSCGMIII